LKKGELDASATNNDSKYRNLFPVRLAGVLATVSINMVISPLFCRHERTDASSEATEKGNTPNISGRQ